MKRLIVSLAIATTLGAAMATPSAALYRSHSRIPIANACRYQMADGHTGFSPYEIKQTIRCAVARWRVPGGIDTAMYIADRESNFHAFAYNPSGCSGVYQWARGTWSSVLPRFPFLYAHLSHSVFNGRSNVMYAIRYAHYFGWAPWGMA